MLGIFFSVFLLAGCGDGAEQGPIVITYGTLNTDLSMESWIASWNRSQSRYRVEIKLYEDNDIGRMQLNKDLVTGRGPDLLDLSDINVANYAAKGVLEDLYPYLDRDERVARETLVQGVMQTYEFDGRLCGLPMGYYFETLLGKREKVGNAKDWTPDRLLGLLQGLDEEEFLMDALSPEGFLRAVFSADMSSYVDMAERRCYFEEAGFRKLLEAASGLEAGNLSEEEHAKGLADGSILLERAYVSDVSDYLNYCGMFGGEEVSWVGFPSGQGGRTVLYTRMPVGISALSQKKDAAWEFMVSLLGEEFQKNYVMFLFPIRMSVLVESLEAAKKKVPDVQLAFEQEWVPATQEQIDALMELIRNSQSESIFDPNIWAIVREEAETLFEQGKEPEEVAGIIQNRVENYILEQE